MKKLNNKGFAITGILYTLLSLFLLILLSVLGGLRSHRMMLERATSSLEETYVGIEKPELVQKAINERKAPISGKYIFERTEPGRTPVNCVSYLKKDQAIDHNVLFIPKDINEYPYYYSFEPQSLTTIGKMTLIKIYDLEEK